MKLELRKTLSQIEEYEVELIEPNYEQGTIIEPLVIPNNYGTCDLELLDFLNYPEFDEDNKFSPVCLKTDSTDSQKTLLKEEIGIPLFNALFTGKILAYYKNVLKKASPLEIQLNITAPQLLNIPWEYMYDDHVFQDFLLITPQKKIMLSRLLNSDVSSDVVSRKTTNKPLRVLVVISEPTDKLNIYPFVNETLEKAWLELLYSNQKIDLEYVEKPASLNKLKEKLRGEKTFDILHFFGHGCLEKNEGVLVFEDDNPPGKTRHQFVNGKQLASLLGIQTKQPDLKLVFLSACLTGRNTGTPFRSVATTLLTETTSLMAVVAMQYRIVDKVASEFAKNFYNDLSDGKSMDEAILIARHSVHHTVDLEKKLSDIQWGIPVYYTRDNAPLIKVSEKTTQNGVSTNSTRQKATTMETQTIARIIPILIGTNNEGGQTLPKPVVEQFKTVFLNQLKEAKKEGILLEAEKQPTEENIKKVEGAIIDQIEKDDAFAHQFEQLVAQLDNLEEKISKQTAKQIIKAKKIYGITRQGNNIFHFKE